MPDLAGEWTKKHTKESTHADGLLANKRKLQIKKSADAQYVDETS